MSRFSDRRSRPQRWRDAVAELVSLQDEYRAWLDSLPDNLAESATAQALRAVCDLDLSELDSVEPPRTARLEEAVAAYRAALEERTRERVPLDWATTQNNLGAALATLGERESGTARLEEAVAAYRAALQERTRERAPLDWATTQNIAGGAKGVEPWSGAVTSHLGNGFSRHGDPRSHSRAGCGKTAEMAAADQSLTRSKRGRAMPSPADHIRLAVLSRLGNPAWHRMDSRSAPRATQRVDTN